MKKTRIYNVEGALLIVLLQYDELHDKYIEIYPDLTENPVYTSKGNPIMLTVEDACAFGEQKDENERLIDCSSCRFYRQMPNTLIGVCINEKKINKPV